MQFLIDFLILLILYLWLAFTIDIANNAALFSRNYLLAPAFACVSLIVFNLVEKNFGGVVGLVVILTMFFSWCAAFYYLQNKEA